jgi:hypothetical protein
MAFNLSIRSLRQPLVGQNVNLLILPLRAKHRAKLTSVISLKPGRGNTLQTVRINRLTNAVTKILTMAIKAGRSMCFEALGILRGLEGGDLVEGRVFSVVSYCLINQHDRSTMAETTRR